MESLWMTHRRTPAAATNQMSGNVAGPGNIATKIVTREAFSGTGVRGDVYNIEMVNLGANSRPTC